MSLNLSNWEENLYRSLQTDLGEDFIVSPATEAKRGIRRVSVQHIPTGTNYGLDLKAYANVSPSGPVITRTDLTESKLPVIYNAEVRAHYTGKKENDFDPRKVMFQGTTSGALLASVIRDAFSLLQQGEYDTPQEAIYAVEAGAGLYEPESRLPRNMAEEAQRKQLQKMRFSAIGREGEQLPPWFISNMQNIYQENVLTKTGKISNLPGESMTWTQLASGPYFFGAKPGWLIPEATISRREYMGRPGEQAAYAGQVELPLGLKGVGKGSLEFGGLTVSPLIRTTNPQGQEIYSPQTPREIVSGSTPSYARMTMLYPGEKEFQTHELANVLWTPVPLAGGAFMFESNLANKPDAYGTESVLTKNLPTKDLRDILSGKVQFTPRDLRGETIPEGRGQVNLGTLISGGQEFDFTYQKGVAAFLPSAEAGRVEIPEYWDPNTGLGVAGPQFGQSTEDVARKISEMWGVDVRRGTATDIRYVQEGRAKTGVKLRRYTKAGLFATGQGLSVEAAGEDVDIQYVTGEAKGPGIAFAFLGSRNWEQQQGIFSAWAGKVGTPEAAELARYVSQRFAPAEGEGARINMEQVTRKYRNITRGLEGDARFRGSALGLTADIFNQVFMNASEQENIRNIRQFGGGYINPQVLDLGPTDPETFRIIEANAMRALEKRGITGDQAQEVFNEYFQLGEMTPEGIATEALQALQEGRSAPKMRMMTAGSPFLTKGIATPMVPEWVGGQPGINLEAQLEFMQRYSEFPLGSGMSPLQLAKHRVHSFTSFTKQALAGTPMTPDEAEQITEDQLISARQLLANKDLSNEEFMMGMENIVEDPFALYQFGKTKAVLPSIQSIMTLAHSEFGEEIGPIVGKYRRAWEKLIPEELRQWDSSGFSPVAAGNQAVSPLYKHFERIIKGRSDFAKHAFTEEARFGASGRYFGNLALPPGSIMYGKDIHRMILKNAGVPENRIDENLGLFNQELLATVMRYPQMGLRAIASARNVGETAFEGMVGGQRARAIARNPRTYGVGVVDYGFAQFSAGDWDADMLAAAFAIGQNKSGSLYAMMSKALKAQMPRETVESYRAAEEINFPNPEQRDVAGAGVGVMEDFFNAVDPIRKAVDKLQTVTMEELAGRGREVMLHKGIGMGVTHGEFRSAVVGATLDKDAELQELATGAPAAYLNAVDMAQGMFEEAAGSRLPAALAKFNFGQKDDRSYFGYSTNVRNEAGFLESNRVYLDQIQSGALEENFMPALIAHATAPVSLRGGRQYQASPRYLAAQFASSRQERKELRAKLEAVGPEEYGKVLEKQLRGMSGPINTFEEMQTHRRRLMNLPIMQSMFAKGTSKTWDEDRDTQLESQFAMQEFAAFQGEGTEARWQGGAVINDLLFRMPTGSIAAGRLARGLQQVEHPLLRKLYKKVLGYMSISPETEQEPEPLQTSTVQKAVTAPIEDLDMSKVEEVKVPDDTGIKNQDDAVRKGSEQYVTLHPRMRKVLEREIKDLPEKLTTTDIIKARASLSPGTRKMYDRAEQVTQDEWLYGETPTGGKVSGGSIEGGGGTGTGGGGTGGGGGDRTTSGTEEEPEDGNRKRRSGRVAKDSLHNYQWNEPVYRSEEGIYKGYAALRKLGPGAQGLTEQIIEFAGASNLGKSAPLIETIANIAVNDPARFAEFEKQFGPLLKQYSKVGREVAYGEYAVQASPRFKAIPEYADAYASGDVSFVKELSKVGAAMPFLGGAGGGGGGGRGRLGGDVTITIPTEQAEKLTQLYKDQEEILTKLNDAKGREKKTLQQDLSQVQGEISKISDKAYMGGLREELAQYTEMIKGGETLAPAQLQRMGVIQKQIGEISEEEGAGWAGRAARRLLGGFGLMYMRSIAGFATQGLGYGMEERQALDQQMATATYAATGARNIPFNQQIALQSQMALAGTNINPLMSLQRLGAAVPLAHDIWTGAAAGIGVYGYSQWAASTMPNTPMGNFLGRNATAIGLGAAGIALGSDIYARTQDEMLGARIGRARGPGGGAPGLLDLNALFWQKYTAPEKYDQTREQATLARYMYEAFEGGGSIEDFFGTTYALYKGSGGAGRRALSGESDYTYYTPTEADIFGATYRELKERNLNWSDQALAGTADFLRRSRGMGYDLDSQLIQQIGLDYQFGGQAAQAAMQIAGGLGGGVQAAYGLEGVRLQAQLAGNENLDPMRRAMLQAGGEAMAQMSSLQWEPGIGAFGGAEQDVFAQERMAFHLGGLAGTPALGAAQAASSAYTTARFAGLSPTMPNFYEFTRGMTPEQAWQSQLRSQALESQGQYRISVAQGARQQMFNIGEAGLGNQLFGQMLNVQPGMEWRAQGLLNRDPIQYALAALGGVNLSESQMRLVTGEQVGGELAAFTDINMQGQVTGLQWGTSSFRLGDVGASTMANRIFGQDWQNNTAYAQNVIKAGVQGVTLPNGQTIGGVQAFQWQNMQNQWAYQEAQMGLQSRQLGVTQQYTRDMWGIQDQMRNLGYRQQEWQFGFNERQLQQQRSQWEDNFALNQTQAMMQRGWTREDWAFNAESRAMQWGWKQEDFEEQRRFMTGRQRKLAERQMERETIMYGREGEQIDRQKSRQEELWRLEDERFDMQRQHYEENYRMQEEQQKMARKFYEERKTLEEQQIKIQRQYQEEMMDIQRDQLNLTQEHAREQQKYAETMFVLKQEMSELEAKTRLLADESMTELLRKFDQLMEAIGLMVGADLSSDDSGYHGTNPEDVPVPLVRPGACFIAGTMVTMSDGTKKPIEEIKPDDIVLSLNLKDGEYIYAKVKDTLAHSKDSSDHLLRLTFTHGKHLTTTPEHLFYTNNGWRAAGTLQVGDSVLTREKLFVLVSYIEVLDSDEATYNIHTSDDSHNYFANGMLVHNVKTNVLDSFISNNSVAMNAALATNSSEINFNQTTIPVTSSKANTNTEVKVYIGNEELRGYIVKSITDEI